MSIDNLVTITEEYLEMVIARTDDELDDVARRIAYYYAMKQAALDDPLDDDSDHAAMVNYFDDNLTELTEKYMDLVNARV